MKNGGFSIATLNYQRVQVIHRWVKFIVLTGKKAISFTEIGLFCGMRMAEPFFKKM